MQSDLTAVFRVVVGLLDAAVFVAVIVTKRGQLVAVIGPPPCGGAIARLRQAGRLKPPTVTGRLPRPDERRCSGPRPRRSGLRNGTESGTFCRPEGIGSPRRPDMLGAGTLSWPVLLAIGWFEGHLAERVASGDPSARRLAGIVLQLQATAAFLLAAAAAAAVARSGQQGWWAQERVRWAWVAPAAVAAAHFMLARMVAARDERSPPIGETSPR